jgi:hypothetical protein
MLCESWPSDFLAYFALNRFSHQQNTRRSTASDNAETRQTKNFPTPGACRSDSQPFRVLHRSSRSPSIEGEEWMDLESFDA